MRHLHSCAHTRSALILGDGDDHTADAGKATHTSALPGQADTAIPQLDISVNAQVTAADMATLWAEHQMKGSDLE